MNQGHGREWSSTEDQAAVYQVSFTLRQVDDCPLKQQRADSFKG